MYREGKANICECGGHCWAPATQWGVVIVDAQDALLLQGYSWHLMNPRRRSPYAKSFRCKSPTTPSGALLHLAVLDFPKQEVDHKNGNGLDCRRNNLRPCGHQENTFNQTARGGTSVHRGVHWSKEKNRWSAQANADGKRKFLGAFDFELDAAICYNYHAAHIHSDFARLNAIPSNEYTHD